MIKTLKPKTAARFDVTAINSSATIGGSAEMHRAAARLAVIRPDRARTIARKCTVFRVLDESH